MTTNVSGGAMHFFTCEVRDLKDPTNAGKCKVHIHGHTNSGEKQIDEEDLPWAHVMHNNKASLNKIGSSTNYLPGSVCIGFWMDPETKQIPVILGSIPKAGESKEG